MSPTGSVIPRQALHLDITRMSCAGRVKRALRVPGVTDAAVNLASEQATVRAGGFRAQGDRTPARPADDRRRSSALVKRRALAHVQALDEKLAQLQALRRSLADLAHNCHGDARPDCLILDDLAG